MSQAPKINGKIELDPEKATGIEYFKLAWLKRRAQFSTVAILKTSDPKRLPQFVKYIYNVYAAASKPFSIYLYKVWGGLFEVKVNEKDEIVYAQVSDAAASLERFVQFLQTSSLPPQPKIRELHQVLAFLDSIMETKERVIVIFWGLFSYKSVSESEHYALVKFLRNAIFDDRYYVKYHFIVIFCEYPEQLLDDDTIKHSIVVDIPPSTLRERKEILNDIAKQLNIDIDDNEIHAYAEALKGLSLHETESVALESIFRYGKFDMSSMIEFKYDIIRKSGLLDIEEPSHGFEAVGGYDILKKFIMNNVIKVLRNPDKARKLGLRPPRGILLFGPPGTGKTWFARALAKELQLPYLRLRTEKIVSMWYGETSRNLAKALEISESVAPAVLFIDEVDRFGRRGGPTEHEESRRAFSILLEWLGDARRKTIVVATTNRPEDLDEAFRRVGRFDYIIPMLYPDFKARLEILKIHTSVVRKVPLASDVDLNYIAKITEYWSGAELEELVLRAARKALEEDSDVVITKHFNRALETFRINQNERQEQLRRYLQLAEEFTNDTEFLEQLKKSYEQVSRIEAVKEF
jgi:SpoVK/Ycf46/Vps4 family AAA+-type ATPase